MAPLSLRKPARWVFFRCILAVVMPMLVPFLLLMSIAGPQERGVARASLFGVVRDAERAPVANARVRLLSRPVPRNERIGNPDRIEVETDARGRFRARVRVGWIYSAWAEYGEGADRYRVSNTVENCVAGQPVSLTLRTGARHAGRFPVEGLAAWHERGPFRVRVVSQIDNVYARTVAVVEDAFELPPLPHARQSLELIGRDGKPLHVVRLVPDTRTLRVPPPVEITLRARAGYRGNGVSGARVYRRTRVHDALLGTTGEDGSLSLRLPRGTHPYGLRVSASGFERSFPLRESDDATDWFADMEKVASARSLRFRNGAGAPLEGLLVRIIRRVYHLSGEGSGGSFQDIVMGRTDATGAIELATDSSTLLHVVLPAKLRSSLFGARSTELHPLLYINDDRPEDTYDLSEYRLVEIGVRRADGSPAPSAEVLIGEQPSRLSKWKQPASITDRRGRIAIALPPQRDIRVLAMLDGQHGFAEVRIPRNLERTPKVELHLREPFWLRGVLVDGKGEPRKGTGIFCSPTQGGFLGTKPAVQPEKEPVARTDGVVVRPISKPEILGRFLSLALNHRDRFRRRGPEFAYPLPAVPWRYFINAFAIRGRDGKTMKVEVTGTREELLRIEIPRGGK